MKNEFTMAIPAASLADDDDSFTPEMGSVDLYGDEYQEWQKPGIIVTNSNGLIMSQADLPLYVYINGVGGFTKPNADKTYFEMSAGGPTLYTEDGKLADQQLPALSNCVPDSPFARNFALTTADRFVGNILRHPSSGAFTAVDRIDASYNLRLENNNKDIFYLDDRLQNLQNAWDGVNGEFGTASDGHKLNLKEVIFKQEDEFKALNNRFVYDEWSGKDNPSGLGAEHTFYMIDTGNTEDTRLLDMGKNADGSNKTVQQYVEEYVKQHRSAAAQSSSSKAQMQMRINDSAVNNKLHNGINKLRAQAESYIASVSDSLPRR